jgi:ATP-dependent RNA helicase UAP56/SUB2
LPNVRTEVFYGGCPQAENVKILKGKNPPHIIIGTPGRILALVLKMDLKLDNLSMFILDECDKMLDETDMRSQVQKIFMSSSSQK